MGKDHAENKHGAEKQGLALVAPSRYICERHRDGGQRHRIETEHQARKECHASGGEARLLHRLRQSFRIHHPRPLFRALRASRRFVTVGIDVTTSSPSITVEPTYST